MTVEGVLPDDQALDLAGWLAADAASHGLVHAPRLCRLRHPTLHYQRLLRVAEQPGGVALRPRRLLALARLKRLSELFGFTIPLGVFGPGLCIVHRGTIVVNAGVQVGRNCRLHHDVTLGQSKGQNPVLGHDVWIAPGAKVIGGVRVGDGAAIGANAVVLEDVPAGVTVAGVPARIVSRRGSHDLLLRGTEIALARQTGIRP